MKDGDFIWEKMKLFFVADVWLLLLLLLLKLDVHRSPGDRIGLGSARSKLEGGLRTPPAQMLVRSVRRLKAQGSFSWR